MAFVGVVTMLVMFGLFPSQYEGQQRYPSKQFSCNESPNSTLGFVCNGGASCSSFLTFRSTPTYNTPITIAYLLAADASQIAAANNISDMDAFLPGTLVIVPVNCSCSGNGLYYQHNASYALKKQSETFFIVAREIYQSLSTCQAMLAQNPYLPGQLRLGINLTVPLRCACSTPSSSFPYLLTYLMRRGDIVRSITSQFAGAGADFQAILDANLITTPSTLFTNIPLLVPLKTQPTAQNILITAPEAPPPPTTALPTAPAGVSYKWLFIGVAVGAVSVTLTFSSVALVWLSRRKPPEPEEAPLRGLSAGIRSAMQSLSIYKVEEVEKATNSFAESNRMKGSWSVYRGCFKGSKEAVVKVMKGDVSREIATLGQINHSRIIRLSGFCLHQATTYLVYDYAPNGSLKEWLRSNSNSQSSLDWEQRLQIAYDVADALNYLHNFTNPPYIHKNLTTSNILLDSNMRAKVSNFGLVRAIGLDDINNNNNVMTRHVVGAQGYMAPEYIDKGLLSTKLDVFAFGVVVLELLSGREPLSSGGDDEDKELVVLSKSIGEILSSGENVNVRERLRRFMDPRLRDKYPMEVACSMAHLANTCVAHNVDSRPSLSKLLVALSSLRSSSVDSWDPSRDVSTYISFSE